MSWTPQIDRYVAICRAPVIIVGAPHSGTDALAAALAQHSWLWTSTESSFHVHLLGGGYLDDVLRRAYATPNDWMQQQGVRRDELLASVGTGINALYTSRSGGRRWIDHTPASTLLVETLAAMFPDAAFLHLLRDARQVVPAMLKDQRFGESLGGNAAVGGASNLDSACSTWSRMVSVGLDFARRYPHRCLTVIHGTLLSDPVGEFRRILGFLRVPPEDAAAAYYGRHLGNVEPAAEGGWETWSGEQRQSFLLLAGPASVECGLISAEELTHIRQQEAVPLVQTAPP